MKNTKALEMLNQRRIEELKSLLQDEIYQEALKGKSGAKQRYAAMKKYFTYVKTSRAALQKPSIVKFEGKNVTSFCNSYSLAFTTESCGEIELFSDSDGNYPDVVRLIKRKGDPQQLDLDKVIAEAKSKGYKLKQSEVNGGQYMMLYNGAYFRLGLVDATYSIIADGGGVTAYHDGGNVSPLVIENDIGLCLVLPVRTDKETVEKDGFTVIEAE